MNTMNRCVRYLLLSVFGLAVFAEVIVCAADGLDGSSFLKAHCIRCHGTKTQEADLRLDAVNGLSPEQLRERWHQVWNKVKDREMPPEDEPQPSDAERSRILDWIRSRYGEPDFGIAGEHWSFQPMVRPDVPQIKSAENNPIDAFVHARLHSQDIAPSTPADRRTLIRRLSLDLTGLPPSPQAVEEFVHDSASWKVAYARVVDRLLQSPRYGERWAQHWLDIIRWAETVGFETNLERPNAWHYRDWVIKSLNDDKPYDRFLFEQLAGDTVGEDAALGFLVAGPANLPGQIGRDEEAMRQARQDELDEVIRTVSQCFFGLTIGCARCHDHKFDPISQRDYYSMQAIFAGLSYGHRRLRGPQNDEWTARVPEIRGELQRLKEQLEEKRKLYQLRLPLDAVTTERFAPVRADAVRMEIAATESGAASLYELEVWSVDSEANAKQNVALASQGATPSASSFALANQTRHFENLIDGSVDQRQAFPWVSAKSGAAWVQIEFAKPAEIDTIIWHSGSSTPASYEIKVRPTVSGTWRTVAHTRDRLPRITDRRDASGIQLDGLSATQVETLVQLIAAIRSKQAEVHRLSAGPQVYAASFLNRPKETYVLRRGDPMQRGEKAVPMAPAAFRKANSDWKIRAEVDRRLALARHLTRADHPLTARVIVNRIWQHHFGVGLVETPSDLGRMGAPPSHPQLLDWLASEFVANGWSIKWLHRQMVMTQTYRQSSRPRREVLKIDADSRLLWRYPPRRMDAETIRDSILAVSGKLNLEMYGRGFDFFNQRGGLSDYEAKVTFDNSGWRRMIYAHKIRMESVDIFGAFDCPDAGQMTPRRSESITPIQSLGLFNSPFIDHQAGFFADRIRSEVKEDLHGSIERAFAIALSRVPSKMERQRLVELAKDHGLKQVCRVIFNSSEFVFLR